MQSWSVGILCYNEEGSLPAVFNQVRSLLSTWNLDQWEIILVDDGSRDNTVKIIHELASLDTRVKPIIHPHNLGIGAGIRSIYFNAIHENVVFIPGDGQFDVTEMLPFPEMNMMEFIAFYREENQTYNTFRNVLSWMNKSFNRMALGLVLQDVNWVKIYKLHWLKKLDLRLHSSAIESEICAKMGILGIRPIEVKSKYLPRVYGSSKGASLKSIYLVIKELLKLFYVVSLFRFRKTNN